MKCKKCPYCNTNILSRSNACVKCAAKYRDNSKMDKNFGDTIGKMNGRWKGDDVGYFALHSWIRKNKPKPEFCVKCNKNKPKDLANISGKYKRDINDFEWLCRKCHYSKDRLYIKDKRDNSGRFIKQDEG